MSKLRWILLNSAEISVDVGTKERNNDWCGDCRCHMKIVIPKSCVAAHSLFFDKRVLRWMDLSKVLYRRLDTFGVDKWQEAFIVTS